jgi:hypothetical protein
MRLVLVLLLAVGVAAQEQKPAPPESPPQTPIFRAGTDLVRVDGGRRYIYIEDYQNTKTTYKSMQKGAEKIIPKSVMSS